MNEQLNLLRLFSIHGIGSMNARKLIAHAGGIDNIFQLSKKDLLHIQGISPTVADKILDSSSIKRAEEELEFMTKYNIKLISYYHPEFPPLLKQCEDSPLMIFTKGKPINQERKYLAIIGTRNATIRGEEFCNRLMCDIRERGHQITIVSGLAYGIDIAAHKAALANGIETIAVLGHGFQTIYPAAHKDYARQIAREGTLVTEYLQGTYTDKSFFVRRNRIIAGLSEATIVVESDEKGGSMLTAELANSYNREVFAVPGRIDDKFSRGCNLLIKTNRANLIQGIEDLEYIMGWGANKKPVQKQLFVELTPEEESIMNVIGQSESRSIDEICRNTGFPVAKASLHLIELEFKGIIKCLPGKVYIKC